MVLIGLGKLKEVDRRHRESVTGVIEPQPISGGIRIVDVNAFRLNPISAPGREWRDEREMRIGWVHARWVSEGRYFRHHHEIVGLNPFVTNEAEKSFQVILFRYRHVRM